MKKIRSQKERYGKMKIDAENGKRKGILIEKQLKEYAETHMEESVSNEELEQIIRLSRTAFYEESEKQPLSKWEFLTDQAGYIRKRWWIFQGLVLVTLWFCMYYSGSNDYVQRVMGVFSSLFAILMVPELWKNQSADSMENEGCSYFSLRQIYAARIFVFGIMDTFLLSLFGGIAAMTLQVTLYEMLIQFFLPFCVTCCICFRTLTGRNGSSEYLAISLSLLWAGIWGILLMREDIYRWIAKPVWLLILAVAIAGLVFSVWKAVGGCDSIWEEKRQWN